MMGPGRQATEEHAGVHQQHEGDDVGFHTRTEHRTRWIPSVRVTVSMRRLSTNVFTHNAGDVPSR